MSLCVTVCDASCTNKYPVKQCVIEGKPFPFYVHFTSELDPKTLDDNTLNSKKQEFSDVFYDDEHFTLIKKRLWLRSRHFKGEEDKTSWSLKKIKGSEPFVSYHEILKEDKILKCLKEVGIDVAEDDDMDSLAVRPFAIFSVTRYLEKENQYVDLASLSKGCQYCIRTRVEKMEAKNVKFPTVAPPLSKVMKLLENCNSDLFSIVKETGQS